MSRICLSFILLVFKGSISAAAQQRLDGCSDSHVLPSAGSRDRGLKESGYFPNRDSLLSALHDLRPDVRSLAALGLASGGNKTDLPPILAAWLSESDTCTKSAMLIALSQLVEVLSWDPIRHPEGQRRVTPFQACTVPSTPPSITLTIEQVARDAGSGPAVRLTARNNTTQTIAFVHSRSPTELFSVSVLNPAGNRARIPRNEQRLYEPERPSNGPDYLATLPGHAPTFVALPPNEDVSWFWPIGDEFEMSEPGTYRVSLGGKIPYLDTTVCSNTAEVIVK